MDFTIGRDGYMYARVVAFGSAPIVDAYQRLRQVATQAAGDEWGLADIKAYGAVHPALLKWDAKFEAAEETFQDLVRRDLG
jgi:hypothetical protein